MLAFLALGYAAISDAASTANSKAFALRVAAHIARYEGYRSGRGHVLEFEITDSPEKQTYPGYVTVQIRNNAQTAWDVSVDPKRRTAYDFLRCTVFRYPIPDLSRSRSASSRRTYKVIMTGHGCESYSVVRHRDP